MAIRDTIIINNDDEKDPPYPSPEWPWSLPRSVMRARYGPLVGVMPPSEMPQARAEMLASKPTLSECDPRPIYTAECQKLGVKPRADIMGVLERLWATYCKRHGITTREPGED